MLFNIDKKGVAERIAHLLVEFNIKNPRQFALSIDMDPSFFNKVINQEVPISEKYIDKICSTYNVSKDWLLYEMGKLKADDKKPSGVIRKLPHEKVVDKPAINKNQVEIELFECKKIVASQQESIEKLSLSIYNLTTYLGGNLKKKLS